MTGQERPPTPQDVFTRVASRYDRINRIASWGNDVRWRAEAAQRLTQSHRVRILDICCGTGVMGELLRAQFPESTLTGVDMNEAMLGFLAARRPGVYDRTVLASAESLPLESGSVDAVVISLGFHDLLDPAAALAEIVRVLRPGGQLLLLELTLPKRGRRRALYVGALRAAVRVRDVLGLGSVGHVLDEVLLTPPDEHLWRLTDAAGLMRRGSTPHGGGLMTSYLLSVPSGRGDAEEGAER